MASVQELEQKTAQTEQLVKQLAGRVDQLERGGVPNAGAGAGVANADVLRELLAIRANLLKLGEDNARLSAHNKQLQEENESLKVKVAKRDYRVQHLLRSLEQAEK